MNLASPEAILGVVKYALGENPYKAAELVGPKTGADEIAERFAYAAGNNRAPDFEDQFFGAACGVLLYVLFIRGKVPA